MLFWISSHSDDIFGAVFRAWGFCWSTWDDMSWVLSAEEEQVSVEVKDGGWVWKMRENKAVYQLR